MRRREKTKKLFDKLIFFVTYRLTFFFVSVGSKFWLSLYILFLKKHIYVQNHQQQQYQYDHHRLSLFSAVTLDPRPQYHHPQLQDMFQSNSWDEFVCFCSLWTNLKRYASNNFKIKKNVFN